MGKSGMEICSSSFKEIVPVGGVTELSFRKETTKAVLEDSKKDAMTKMGQENKPLISAGPSEHTMLIGGFLILDEKQGLRVGFVTTRLPECNVCVRPS